VCIVRVFYASHYKWLCASKGAGFLYARPEMQSLIEPLVVSWGYESITPSGSTFIDEQEWWGTRDMASFLAVPAAIEFQAANNWDQVRVACHQLAREAQARICELTGLAPLHSQSDHWFCQMTAAPLPEESDIDVLKTRLYDEYRVEIPLGLWKDRKLIRVSIQGYNTNEDVDVLLDALSEVLDR
jgi:isopenicillin-N epimerase